MGSAVAAVVAFAGAAWTVPMLARRERVERRPIWRSMMQVYEDAWGFFELRMRVA
jgi:hypothetical protein